VIAPCGIAARSQIWSQAFARSSIKFRVHGLGRIQGAARSVELYGPLALIGDATVPSGGAATKFHETRDGLPIGWSATHLVSAQQRSGS
jgi:hypothetical protein